MFTWSLLFFIIAIIAALFGYTGIAKEATKIAKIIFFVALGFLVISLGFSLITM